MDDLEENPLDETPGWADDLSIDQITGQSDEDIVRNINHEILLGQKQIVGQLSQYYQLLQSVRLSNGEHLFSGEEVTQFAAQYHMALLQMNVIDASLQIEIDSDDGDDLI